MLDDLEGDEFAESEGWSTYNQLGYIRGRRVIPLDVKSWLVVGHKRIRLVGLLKCRPLQEVGVCYRVFRGVSPICQLIMELSQLTGFRQGGLAERLILREFAKAVDS